MKLYRILIVFSAVTSFDLPTVQAAPAKFWLSYSNVDPIALETPPITGVENATRYLYIWAQPGTVAAGEYNVNSNRFQTIRNFSLNLVTNVLGDNSEPIVDMLNGTFTVYNPLLDGKYRYQFTYDSHTTTGALLSTGAALDGIEGMQGFSVSATAANGIGHSPNHATVGCHPGDLYCALTPQQSPAWLIASVGVKTTSPTGLSKLHLQIGGNGMSYGTSQITEVAFGANGLNVGPLYNSSDAGHRGSTLPLDDPDAQFTAVAPTEVLLSTWNAGSGDWIVSTNWTGNVVPASFAKNAKLPSTLGANVVTVTGKQLANETIVEGGRLHIVGGASLASAVTVASGGGISGQGWVGSDLTLQSGARLTVDSSQPLLVVGSANVAGATLRLGSNFTGSGSPTPLEILRTLSGIQGSFAPATGQNLGGGLSVGSISTSTDGTSILLQISGVAGDFDRNNTVDTADYVLWRNSAGCDINTAACLNVDGNHNGVIDQADYNVWRAHFDQTADNPSASVHSAAIPEPSTCLMLLAGLMALAFRRGAVL